MKCQDCFDIELASAQNSQILISVYCELAVGLFAATQYSLVKYRVVFSRVLPLSLVAECY